MLSPPDQTLWFQSQQLSDHYGQEAVNRKPQVVKIKDKRSKAIGLCYGVPQGSVVVNFHFKFMSTTLNCRCNREELCSLMKTQPITSVSGPPR